MFQFPRLSLTILCVQIEVDGYDPIWVAPFGDLRLITPMCSSPQLIAACHVLHRLSVPRHPPCALNIFIFIPPKFAYENKTNIVWVDRIRDRVIANYLASLLIT